MTAKTTKNIATHFHEHLRVRPFSNRGGLNPRRTPPGLQGSVPAPPCKTPWRPIRN